MIYDINGNIVLDSSMDRWKGKKIIVDGSSLTNGGNTSPGAPRWADYLGDMLDATIYNHGLSGSQWVYYYGGDRTTSYMRISDYEQDADCIITMGDFSSSASGMGTISDAADISSSYYYPKLKAYAEALITAFPLIPIIWAIEPPRNWEDPNNPTGRAETLAKAIKEVAELYGFPVADCFHQTIYRPYNETNYAANTSDGTHPWNNIHHGMAYIVLDTLRRTPTVFPVD